MQNKINEKQKHETGIKGIYTKYICKEIFLSIGLWISIIMSITCFTYLYYFSTLNDYELLIKIIEKNISIFPSILGFCIAGYALIIGFGSREILKKIAGIDIGGNMSIFQYTSRIFATAIIVQVITLLSSFLVWHLLNLEINSLNAKFINTATISFIFFTSLYSIILIGYTVTNVFNFGQLIHACVKEEIINENENANKTDNL